jgi:hypothetical protein
VKQSDSGEYEENAREKQNIQYTRKSRSSPSNQAIRMTNTKFSIHEGSNQNMRFLNAKDHTPPESKENQTKHRMQPKTSTPPEVENLRFYQMSLNKPEGKHRPLKQQSKSKRI